MIINIINIAFRSHTRDIIGTNKDILCVCNSVSYPAKII